MKQKCKIYKDLELCGCDAVDFALSDLGTDGCHGLLVLLVKPKLLLTPAHGRTFITYLVWH